MRAELNTTDPAQVVTALAQAKARHIGQLLTSPDRLYPGDFSQGVKVREELESIPAGERLVVVGCY